MNNFYTLIYSKYLLIGNIYLPLMTMTILTISHITNNKMRRHVFEVIYIYIIGK